MSDESETQEHGAGAGPEYRDVNRTEAERRHPRRERTAAPAARAAGGSARLVRKKNAVVVICSSRPIAQNATHHEVTHADDERRVQLRRMFIPHHGPRAGRAFLVDWQLVRRARRRRDGYFPQRPPLFRRAL